MIRKSPDLWVPAGHDHCSAASPTVSMLPTVNFVPAPSFAGFSGWNTHGIVGVTEMVQL